MRARIYVAFRGLCPPLSFELWNLDFYARMYEDALTGSWLVGVEIMLLLLVLRARSAKPSE